MEPSSRSWSPSRSRRRRWRGLQAHCDVERTTTRGLPCEQAELIRRLQGKAGVFVTGSERIDAELLDAYPQLQGRVQHGGRLQQHRRRRPAPRAACSVTNTPDVLTETTADFGFALMMATARRIAESERFLRARRVDEVGATTCSPAPTCTARRSASSAWAASGRAIARRGALGFGMQVIYHNRSRLAPSVEARARRALRRQGRRCCARPTTWCSCVPYSAASAPHDRRGRARADEADRDADQHRARRHRRRRRAGARRCANGASPRPGSTCSRASPRCIPTCSRCPTSC